MFMAGRRRGGGNSATQDLPVKTDHKGAYRNYENAGTDHFQSRKKDIAVHKDVRCLTFLSRAGGDQESRLALVSLRCKYATLPDYFAPSRCLCLALAWMAASSTSGLRFR